MKRHLQVAALPVRWSRNGTLKVLLVTTRETRRWIVPKGWPSKQLKDHKMAALEAEEEAGVIGKIRSDPVGTFHYVKRLPRKSVEIEVTLFRLDVRRQLKRWREKSMRKRRWFSVKEAAKRVQEPELRCLIKALAKQPNRSNRKPRL